jgi:hypothetical protein
MQNRSYSRHLPAAARGHPQGPERAQAYPAEVTLSLPLGDTEDGGGSDAVPGYQSDADGSNGLVKSRATGLWLDSVFWPLVERLQRELEATETDCRGEGRRHTHRQRQRQTGVAILARATLMAPHGVFALVSRGRLRRVAAGWGSANRTDTGVDHNCQRQPWSLPLAESRAE